MIPEDVVRQRLPPAVLCPLIDRSYYPPAPALQWPDSELGDEDLATLQQRGIIAEVSPHFPATGYIGKAFTVAEPAKRRRRFILDTIGANLWCPDPAEVCFNSIQHVCQEVMKGNWVASVDFSAFYFQFALGVDVVPLFCFRCGNKYFALQRLPMGFKASVAIAQHFSESLVATSCDVYIDNILVYGQREECSVRMSGYVGVCDSLGVTLSESIAPTQRITHRGVEMDVQKESHPHEREPGDKVGGEEAQELG